MTSRIGNIVLEEGALPEEYFRCILASLQDEAFLRIDGSWKLVRVFEENWKELSELQRAALLPVLEASYGSFHDWIACFVISGILESEMVRGEVRESLSRLGRRESKRRL